MMVAFRCRRETDVVAATGFEAEMFDPVVGLEIAGLEIALHEAKRMVGQEEFCDGI